MFWCLVGSLSGFTFFGVKYVSLSSIPGLKECGRRLFSRHSHVMVGNGGFEIVKLSDFREATTPD